MYKVPLIKNAFINEIQTRQELSEFVKSNNQLSMGEKCQEFETEFSIKQGRKYSVLFNSGGSANLALIQALKNIGKVQNNDNVGFSAVTWATNVMPIIQMNLNPIPIDIEKNTINISNDSIRLAKNLKLLFVTNALGFMPDYDFIINYCNNNNIILIEDNCESLGSERQGRKSGNAGLASTFSFYIAHHLSTIEGGMVCTDDYELYQVLKLVRANGWDRNTNMEFKRLIRKKHNIEGKYSQYTFYDLGYNFRPTEITGYLGLNQLKYMEVVIKARERNYNIINEHLKKNPDIIENQTKMEVTSAFAIPLIFKTLKSKNIYLARFENELIETRPIISGNMICQPFWKKYVKEKYYLPNAQHIHDCGFYCGNYPEMTDEERSIIIGVLNGN